MDQIPKTSEGGLALIEVFYAPQYIDCYTFVFDEVDSHTHLYTMLGTSMLGESFSQWTAGSYDPQGENRHLGKHVPFQELAKPLIKHVLSRMHEGNEE
ncbi:MAG: hypothetical protein H0U76_13950 [Ktedonobacteraceae bacterium]|nr:hypothetical protein [Ktedonobacteraceae bacterium]